MLCTRGFRGWACSNILCYSSGKAKSCKQSWKAGIPYASHRIVYEMTMACRRAGCKVASGLKFDGLQLIIMPSYYRRIPQKDVALIPNRKTAILSGWGLDARAIHRFGTNVSIPLSDHADFNELTVANQVRPKRIITVTVLQGSLRVN